MSLTKKPCGFISSIFKEVGHIKIKKEKKEANRSGRSSQKGKIPMALLKGTRKAEIS